MSQSSHSTPASANGAPIAPGTPVAQRLSTPGIIFWLMRHPSSAIGRGASLTIPFASVARTLLITQIAFLFIALFALLAVARQFADTHEHAITIQRVIKDLTGYVLASTAIELLGSYLLACVLLTWWRVPSKARRPWDLTGLLFAGVVVATLVYTSLSLTIGAVFGSPSELSTARFLLREGIGQALAAGAYLIIGYWTYRLVRPVTPPAELHGTICLIAAVVAGRWAFTLKLTRYLWIVYAELMNWIYWMLPI